MKVSLHEVKNHTQTSKSEGFEGYFIFSEYLERTLMNIMVMLI